MMRRFWIAVIVVMAAFVIETRFTPFGLGLNVTVLLAYYVGLRYGPMQGVLAGAAIGAAADSVSGGMLGPMMLSKSTAGYMASNLRSGLLIWTPALGVMAVMAVTLVDGLMAHGALSVFGQGSVSLGEVSKTVFWQALINAAAGLLIRPREE